MFSKLAELDTFDMEIGVGQALYDNPENPTKRYFLEKRWKKEGGILGVIMINPSNAGALESDHTVTALMNKAKQEGYAALYVVNMIPYINPSINILKKSGLDLDSIVTEEKQIKSFDLLLKESTAILMAWGKEGQKKLPILMKNNQVRELFESRKENCKVIGYGGKGKFPYHPLPRGFDKHQLSKAKFVNAAEKVQEWVEKYQ